MPLICKTPRPLLIQCGYDIPVDEGEAVFVDLHYLTVVGHDAVDLDFHVGNLGVDCGGAAGADERLEHAGEIFIHLEELLAVGYVDLCIPRGGKRLIEFVRDNARVPVIETGAGVVNTYFDADADLAIGQRIVNNAKTRRVSVCNALDCLIVHRSRLDDLGELCAPLAASHVTLYADEPAYTALQGQYPSELLRYSTPESYGTEFMDYVMAIRTVDSAAAAIQHISTYGSGHSECIITENAQTAAMFQSQVDAACVYVNAPTSFTDGAQFGLGAEIGISTQKLGPRGPMALDEMTTYKWLIEGHGQVRA